MEKTRNVGNYSGFVASVIRRSNNPADTAFVANMRRADNPNQCSAAWEFLVPFCDIADKHQLLCFALVGAAIAREKPAADGTGSVGAALRKICGDDSEALERERTRLRRLIACETVWELLPVLRPILGYIQGKGISVNYTELLRELLFWNENIRIAWTRDFFQKSADADPEKEAE